MSASWLGLSGLSWIKQLRTLRALRPARALSRNEGTKVVINALIGAIPSFINVVLVCMILWIIFSIIGVSLFAGKFAKCVWTQNMTMLPPKYRYDRFEYFLTGDPEGSLASNYATSDYNEQNLGVISANRLKMVYDFIKREKRDEYYRNEVKFSYYDGQMIDASYLIDSYRAYRNGSLFLPKIDQKNPRIPADQWQITKDSCMALGEASLFMNCHEKGLVNNRARNTGRWFGEKCIKDHMNPDDMIEFRWVVDHANFDNIMNGLLTLLHLATFMGWVELVEIGSDTTRMYQQPQFENSMASISFFIIFIILGSFFTLNLYIGVIIDSFNVQKEKTGKSIFKTESQVVHSHVLRKFQTNKPEDIPRPDGKIKNMLYDLFKNRSYELAIMGIITLNVGVMCFEHHGMDDTFEENGNLINHENLFRINILFSIFFSTELILKLVTHTPQYFFKNFWNVLDLVIEASTFISMLLESIFEELDLPSGLIRLLRLLRISRVLRLIKKAKGVKTLLHAFIMSGHALFNVSLLLILIVLIFSLFAMANFPWVIYGGVLNDIFNFKTFYSSFLSLFAVTTSAGWNLFLQPMMSTPPDCDINWQPYDSHFNQTALPTLTNGNCGLPGPAKAFFVLFLLLSFMIVVNIYIAVILENYEIAIKEAAEPVEDTDCELFYEKWKEFATDPGHEDTIDQKDLEDFCGSLDGNLKLPKQCKSILVKLNPKTLAKGRIHVSDVLKILMRKKLAQDDANFDEFFDRLCKLGILKIKRPNANEYCSDYRTHQREWIKNNYTETNVLGTNVSH